MRRTELDNDLLGFSWGHEKLEKYSIHNGGVGRLVALCFSLIAKQWAGFNGE